MPRSNLSKYPVQINQNLPTSRHPQPGKNEALRSKLQGIKAKIAEACPPAAGWRKRIKGFHMPGDEPLKEIKVVAYSGYKANERPLRLLIDDKDLEVEQIIDRWYGEDHDFFKCLTNDGQVFLLKWHRIRDQWFLLPGPN